jgi:hypothetical protein
VEALEQIVRHFMGNVTLDEENVNRIVARVEDTPQGEAPNVDEPFDVQFVSKNIAHYSGKFLHWNFSQKLRRKISGSIERFGVYRMTESEKWSMANLPHVDEYWRRRNCSLLSH